ncbi:MAG: peptide chain release factor N(5)-glutamine methyltransferase [Pseudomonadota bacterium]
MPTTVRQALRQGFARLRDAGDGEAQGDAAVLLCAALGKDRTWLLAWPDKPLSRQARQEYATYIERRARGEPVAYITGRREFWSLELEVSPATLVPRPDTELLVERVLSRVKVPGAQVADLGTGSGAVAAALAHEHPDWRITATDLSEAALAMASANFRRLGLPRVTTLAGDWFGALGNRRFDAIASNPPYVAEGDPHLAGTDLGHEPTGALIAGPDGLNAIRILVAGAPAHLNDGGWLFLEHGHEQGKQVRKLLANKGFSAVASFRDLAGHQRVTEGCWKPQR